MKGSHLQQDHYKWHRRWPTIFAVCLTILYSIVAYCLIDFDAVGKLSPIDLATFLSGMVSPLAIIWLVCGYFLQNTELRINSATLAAQIHEMKESVEQQSKQANSIALTESHTKRDIILKLNEVYLSRLAGFASTITAAFNVGRDTIENGWNFYGAGDREYFFRVLESRFVNQGTVDMILEAQEQASPGVSAAINGFIAEFKHYAKQVASLDDSGEFSQAIERSTAKKIFVALQSYQDRQVLRNL